MSGPGGIPRLPTSTDEVGDVLTYNAGLNALATAQEQARRSGAPGVLATGLFILVSARQWTKRIDPVWLRLEDCSTDPARPYPLSGRIPGSGQRGCWSVAQVLAVAPHRMVDVRAIARWERK